MKLQWDEAKNKANIRKHGIDFADAWQLFEHPLVTWHDDRFDYDEDRYIGIGMMNDMMVVIMVFVERGTDTIRVISMRKAKKHERERYQTAFKD
ncbi:MAG: BrnT family toxin [Nitrospiraceae bacterium]|nr:BrnT family toxin [Nitrospiraceae bacterium]